jgi:hypothetical protein
VTVITDFNIKSDDFVPMEVDSPLIINPYTMLPNRQMVQGLKVPLVCPALKGRQATMQLSGQCIIAVKVCSTQIRFYGKRRLFFLSSAFN